MDECVINRILFPYDFGLLFAYQYRKNEHVQCIFLLMIRPNKWKVGGSSKSR